jgi:hypothetical protein
MKEGRLKVCGKWRKANKKVYAPVSTIEMHL